MSQPTLGEIRMFGGNFAPRSWALCEGQLLSISQNQALFSILGTTYGGDGRTTFGLPDMRGRVPVSVGQFPGSSENWQAGEKKGTETNTMIAQNLPSHNHTGSGTLMASSGDGDTGVADGNSLAHQARGNSVPNIYNNGAPGINMHASSATVTTQNSGANQAINNLQPYNVVNYIICLQGLFPSRN